MMEWDEDNEIPTTLLSYGLKNTSDATPSGQAYSVMAEEADVYVVGSGAEDNARLLDKRGPLEEAGLRRAIEVGRGGKGVVVVVPPGNGGSRGDSCAFDGMV